MEIICFGDHGPSAPLATPMVVVQQPVLYNGAISSTAFNIIAH